jgi:hypothetical protein
MEKVRSCCGFEPTLIQRVILDRTPLILFNTEEINECCYQKAVSSLAAIRVKGIDLSKRVETFSN